MNNPVVKTELIWEGVGHEDASPGRGTVSRPGNQSAAQKAEHVCWPVCAGQSLTLQRQQQRQQDTHTPRGAGGHDSGPHARVHRGYSG